LAGTVPANLSADQLPGISLTSGLVWRGARFNLTAGQALAAARSLKSSAGLPVTASKLFATINTDARLINLSTRGNVGAGANQMIAGFVIEGQKNILIRAAGPALAAFGVGGTLADPIFQVGSTSPPGFDVRTNDNSQQGNATPALFTRL